MNEHEWKRQQDAALLRDRDRAEAERHREYRPAAKMTRADYDALPGLNFSRLKHVLRSPAHAVAAMEEEETTEAMAFGAAYHVAIFEPDQYEQRVAVAPKVDRRTTVGKETWSAFQAESNGKIVLTAEQDETISAMAKVLLSHPDVMPLFERKHYCEKVVQWTDDETGLACKAMLDLVTVDDRPTIADLKTTTDASDMARIIERYQYDVQLAMYRAASMATGFSEDVNCLLICQEKEAPYGAIVYDLREWLPRGYSLYRKAIAIWQRCQETNEWPSYEPGIRVAELPAYLR